MSKYKINLKDAGLVPVHGLETALRMEKDKYAKCPVKPDLVADCEKLAALVLPPRFHLLRYHGVLAPSGTPDAGHRAWRDSL